MSNCFHQCRRFSTMAEKTEPVSSPSGVEPAVRISCCSQTSQRLLLLAAATQVRLGRLRFAHRRLLGRRVLHHLQCVHFAKRAVCPFTIALCSWRASAQSAADCRDQRETTVQAAYLFALHKRLQRDGAYPHCGFLITLARRAGGHVERFRFVHYGRRQNSDPRMCVGFPPSVCCLF